MAASWADGAGCGRRGAGIVVAAAAAGDGDGRDHGQAETHLQQRPASSESDPTGRAIAAPVGETRPSRRGRRRRGSRRRRGRRPGRRPGSVVEDGREPVGDGAERLAHPVRIGEAGRDERQQLGARQAIRDVALDHRDTAACRSATRCRPPAARAARARSESRRRAPLDVRARSRLGPRRAAPCSRRSRRRTGGITFAGSKVCDARSESRSSGSSPAAGRRAPDAARPPEAIARSPSPGSTPRRLSARSSAGRPGPAAGRRAGARSTAAAWRSGLSAPAGNRGVTGAAGTRRRSEADLLLADRDGHDAAPVGELEQHAAALVEREVAAQVGALADQPRHPDVGGVALLVGLGDQDDVAARALAAARERGEARRRAPPSSPFMSAAPRPTTRPSRSDPLERRHGPVRRPAPGRRRCGAISISDGPSPVLPGSARPG